MNSRDRETLIGAGVVLAGALILAVSYGGAGRASLPGYDLVAHFNKADGIGLGSDVRLSGVSVGKVAGQALDDRFRAIITMRMAPDVPVPADSAALIQTDGLLGAKYIAIQPGADEVNLKAGEEMRYSQDSMNLQDLLELIIAQAQAKRAGANKTGGAAAKPQ
ncbi:MlaD family protein [Telmatospirillum siberiense]|uniref:Organic solvent ABC transporter substrate-binding protein n=1 Tax=Telmatospirillum siberiense TaxID=382514 RepID=A0A2N3PLZ7_9PROT|nr:MlaD family protein [Telmatospirillum siberiense]PKU21415.1 organic solvent ABC transporter substrate-binding protein [Telmatospirillum siberiense]